jgi:hypothetical protein
MVLTSVTCAVTSCARSLSPVEISTRRPLGLGHAGERADGVVGLDAGHLEHRPAQQAHDLVDGPDLLHAAARAWARAAPCTGVPGIAEGRTLGVEDAGGQRGREALAQPLHHRHHAVQAPVGKPSGERRSGIAW